MQPVALQAHRGDGRKGAFLGGVSMRPILDPMRSAHSTRVIGGSAHAHISMTPPSSSSVETLEYLPARLSGCYCAEPAGLHEQFKRNACEAGAAALSLMAALAGSNLAAAVRVASGQALDSRNARLAQLNRIGGRARLRPIRTPLSSSLACIPSRWMRECNESPG